jgi:hypothetical protein
MNANELADELETATNKLIGKEYELGGRAINFYTFATTMLRQQQAELDAFKLQYYNTGYSIQLRDKDETIRQQQAEIEALKALLEQEGIGVGRDLLNGGIALFRKASEK